MFYGNETQSRTKHTFMYVLRFSRHLKTEVMKISRIVTVCPHCIRYLFLKILRVERMHVVENLNVITLKYRQVAGLVFDQ